MRAILTVAMALLSLSAIAQAGEFTLKGRVLDDKGAPVKQAYLGALAQGATTFEGIPHANSDDEGHFTLTVPDRPAQLFVVATRFKPLRFDIKPDASADDLVITLQRGGHIVRGRILDESGKPVAGALFECSNQRTKTDKEGRYQFVYARTISTSNSDAGQPIRSIYPVIRHPDHVALDTFALPIDVLSEATEKDFILNKAGVAVGRITDQATGKPLPGIVVTAGRDRFSSNKHNPEAKTNSDGRFRLTGVPPGNTYLHAFSENWAPQKASLTFASGSETKHDFALDAGKPVTGKVVDQDGTPLDDVWLVTDTWDGVRMFERQTHSAKDGAFTLPHMPSGDVEVHVMKEGYASRRDLHVQGGQSDLSVTLFGPAKISGRVVDSATREPIRSFSVVQGLKFHNNERIHWQEDRPQKFEDADGRFEIVLNELTNYDVTIKVRADGYGPTRREDVMARQGQSVKDLEVLMSPGTVLKGRVVDAQANPVAGALVKLFNSEYSLYLTNYYSNPSTGPQCFTNDDGTFSLTGMEDGTYNIYAKQDGIGVAFVMNVEIGPSSPPLDVTLEPYAAIEGYIYHGDQPVPKATIAAQIARNSRIEPAQLYLRTESDENGYFRIDALPALKYDVIHHLSAGSDNIYARRDTVNLVPGQTAFCVLGGEGGAVLKGRVTTGNNAPLANLAVSLFARGASPSKYFGTLSDANGRFEIHDVPPGNYDLSARRFSMSGAGNLSFTEKLAVTDSGDIEHDIHIAERRPLAVGHQLPVPKLTKLDDSPLALSDFAEERFLLANYTSASPEASAFLDWVVEHAEALRAKHVRPLILISFYEDTDKCLAQLRERFGERLPEDVYILKPSWGRELNKTTALPNPLPPMLIDRNGKCLAFGMNFADFEPALQESSP